MESKEAQLLFVKLTFTRRCNGSLDNFLHSTRLVL